MNVKSLLIAVVVLALIGFGVFFGGTWVVNQLENASNPAAVEEPAETVAVDMPDLDPVPGTASADSTPEPAQEPILDGDAPVVTRNDALALLAEVDQLHNLTKADGWGDDSFRFNADGNGNIAAAAFFVTQPGTLRKLAYVCDDVCVQVVLVRGNTVMDLTEAFQVYVPEGTAPEDHYGQWVPSTEIASPGDIDTYVGLQPDDILAGWAANDLNLEVVRGDYIVVTAKDDDSLNVQVGITSFFNFRPDEGQ